MRKKVLATTFCALAGCASPDDRTDRDAASSPQPSLAVEIVARGSSRPRRTRRFRPRTQLPATCDSP